RLFHTIAPVRQPPVSTLRAKAIWVDRRRASATFAAAQFQIDSAHWGSGQGQYGRPALLTELAIFGGFHAACWTIHMIFHTNVFGRTLLAISTSAIFSPWSSVSLARLR